MIKRLAALVTLLAVLLPVTSGFGPALAAGDGPQVIASSAAVDFPLELAFSLKATSDSAIVDVRLHYQVERDSFASVVAEIKPLFTPGTNIDLEWTMNLRQVGGFPTGTVVEYWWTLADAGGKAIRSERQSVIFADTRYQWQSLTRDNLTLYWYQGNNAFAQSLMDTAREGLARLEEDTGAYLENPVEIYIYASSNDLRGAMIYPQEWTGGAAYLSYGTIVIGIAPSNLEWGKRAMVHELAHLVTHQMTRNPYGDLPNWLVEGLSMYAEGNLEASFRSTLVQALRDGSTISVRSLCSPFSASGDISYLSYAQSFSLIDYLVSTYGQARLSQLLAVFQLGSTYDGAFLEVYGFDLAGLDSRWQPYALGQYVPELVGAAA